MINKTLIDIWPNIRPGDIVLFQKRSSATDVSKPRLVIIVGIDIWDMAVSVSYTDYKMFPVSDMTVDVKIEYFGEWMEFWNVLGHWHTMPTFKELLNAYRNHEKYILQNLPEIV